MSCAVILIDAAATRRTTLGAGVRTLVAFAAALFALMACAGRSESARDQGEKVLRFVPQSDLQILDPVWTTAAVTRNHGYMIYDTLFGTDAEGRMAPQMVEKWDVSKDRKTWTFTLRDGLEFHDGKPVTSDDVIASLQRWSQRDNMGQKLLSFLESWEAPDAKTFCINLKIPYGLMLESLGKTVLNVPFVMPKRVAETPADRQIDDYTGSGPFIFNKDEWRPGEKVVYTRNPKYFPRHEPPSGTAGGKVAKVERVEWIIIKDAQTQANALAAGEVDVLEWPAFEQIPALKGNPDVQLVDINPHGHQYLLRFNHVEPPFNNRKVRQAATAALSQAQFLQTQVGIPGLYRECFSVYPCDSPYFTTKGMDSLMKPEPSRARQLLKESGYHNTPVIVMQAADYPLLAKLPVVALQQLRQAGFNVEMQSMSWQELVARRAKKEGWSIFFTNSTASGVSNPIFHIALNAACEKAWFGWPCDSELETLRDAFARAEDEQEQKQIAEQVQVRAMEIGAYVPLGEHVITIAARKNIKGFVTGHGELALWNVEKE